MAVIVTVDQNEYSVSEQGSQIVTAYLTCPSATGGRYLYGGSGSRRWIWRYQYRNGDAGQWPNPSHDEF